MVPTKYINRQGNDNSGNGSQDFPWRTVQKAQKELLSSGGFIKSEFGIEKYIHPPIKEKQRLSWETYFITLAFIIAQKSLDPDTLHGTIIVGEDNSILGTGYNSFPRGCKDDEMPTTRPEKYKVILHSEIAAIVNCAKNGTKIDNSTFYISGEPCESCLKAIINSGASKIVHGKVKSSCIDHESEKAKQFMLRGQKIKIVEYDGSDILELLGKTTKYVQNRNI